MWTNVICSKNLLPTLYNVETVHTECNYVKNSAISRKQTNICPWKHHLSSYSRVTYECRWTHVNVSMSTGSSQTTCMWVPMTVQCKQKHVSLTHVCMYKNCVSVTAQLLARGVYSYIVPYSALWSWTSLWLITISGVNQGLSPLLEHQYLLQTWILYSSLVRNIRAMIEVLTLTLVTHTLHTSP